MSSTKVLGQPVPLGSVLVQHFFSDPDGTQTGKSSQWPTGLLPLRGTLTGWRNGLTDRNLMKINKVNCQVLSQGSNNPKLQYRPGVEQLNIRWSWKDLGLMEHKLAVSQHWALAAVKISSTLGCIRESMASRWKVILPLFSAVMRHIWSVGPGSGLSHTRVIST